MKKYDHTKIEKTWQKVWDTKKVYKTEAVSKKKKHYVLDMFPYPSGAGLHVGHPRGYIGSDVYARMKRMEGYNVLHPMGYDAFGLPAEQYAIEHKVHPRKAVEKNIATFRGQLDKIGFSYDWSRAVNTTDPGYYKWTQWIFLELYNSYYDTEKNKARPIAELIKKFNSKGGEGFTGKEWKGFSKKQQQDILMKYRLAYEGYAEVNWCPQLGTVLANDEIVDDKNGNPVSERGGYPVEKKSMRQWFMRITSYADRLISDLDTLDWSSHIKEIQKNWIGKSEGSEIEFKTSINRNIKVFTTRADTLFGVTYVVLSPEHESIGEFIVQSKNMAEVSEYIREAKARAKKGNLTDDKEKTGIELKGITAINPANGEEVPVWIADYVLAGYGTGAVMAVPAHDERDFEFATKYNLPIKDVVSYYYYPTGVNAPRDNVETLDRLVVDAVIENSNGEFLLEREDKNGVTAIHLVGGGTEGEEDAIALHKEIIEETGFTSFEIVSKIPVGISAYAFRHTKLKNQKTFGYGYHVKLKDDTQIKSEVDEGKHSLLWVKKDTVKDLITWPHHLQIWNTFLSKNKAFTEFGKLINSNQFTGLTSEEARIKITTFVEGKIVTKFKMRDAIFARQRYWGEPIPLVHDKEGIISEVAQKNLPLTLPNVTSYEPTGTGESPLASVKSWVKAGYETNTMPGWAGSSWYFLRYMDPTNKKAFADKKHLKYWKEVDMYVGGQEHATGHLLYARFWHKFLFDMGYVPTAEPFRAMKNQGMILATDGRKMSKRWGNVINPDEIVKNYGADTLRVYEMFMGPFEASQPWSTESIIGSRRFIERVWKLGNKIAVQAKQNQENLSRVGTPGERVKRANFADSVQLETILHKTIKKVTNDIKDFAFNTAVSSMMICINEMEKAEYVSVDDFKLFLQILAPFAPHMTEELWHELGEKKSIHLSKWPKYNEKKIVEERLKIGVSVNGKVRAELAVTPEMTEEEIKAMAHKDEAVIKWLEGKEIKRTIYVKGRLVNIVI